MISYVFIPLYVFRSSYYDYKTKVFLGNARVFRKHGCAACRFSQLWLRVQQAMLWVQQAMLRVQQAMLQVQQAMLCEINNKAKLSPAELELGLSLAIYD